jgi:Tfp pilus assembly protein PilO
MLHTLYKKTISLYITVTVVLIVFIGASLLLFKEMKNRISAVRAIYDRIASIEKYESIYKEEKEKIDSIENSLMVLEKEIVTPTTLPLVLSGIELLGKDLLLTVEISSAQIISPRGKNPYASISIKTEGSYDQLLSFMNKIEDVRSESSIESFTLTQSILNNENMWELMATIFVLSYKE